MTVPGVNVICAATFLATIGDIGRFRSPRKLVAYLGLDPRVRQSGSGPATHGHISRQGSRPARQALVEACWSAVRQPGPLRAFYQRVRARRGHQVAVVASARKLACLFWCLLTREQDYAFARTTTTAAPRPSRRAVVHVCLPYRSVTMTEPLHSTTCAAPAQPVQRAASWWACR